MKSLNLKTLMEKLDIKPVNLADLRTTGFPLKKINKPTYYDLIIRGNVAVTGEGVYICINGADYTWTSANHKKPMMIMPSHNTELGYECLHSDSYKDFFPYAYGRQEDHVENEHLIGWVRSGDEEHENSGLAVVLSNSEQGGSLHMYVDTQYAGESFYDVLGNCTEPVIIGEDGCGDFRTEGRNVAIWVRQAAFEDLVINE